MAVGGSRASAVNSDNGGGGGGIVDVELNQVYDKYVKTILQDLFATNSDADRQLDATLIIIMNTSKFNTCDTS